MAKEGAASWNVFHCEVTFIFICILVQQIRISQSFRHVRLGIVCGIWRFVLESLLQTEDGISAVCIILGQRLEECIRSTKEIELDLSICLIRFLFLIVGI